MTNSATSLSTIKYLRHLLASLGFFEVIVSNNAAAFTSDEFVLFLKKNGVKHVRTPPYHLESNGLAEKAVQIFKEGMKKLKHGSLETQLSFFLFMYRLIPHMMSKFELTLAQV